MPGRSHQSAARTPAAAVRALAVGLLLATAGIAHASVLDVLPDGTGPYPDLRQALLAAQPGDTISLADGVFTGPDNRNLVLGDDLTLRSASGDPAGCILDIQQLGRALTILSMPGAAVLVEGLTLRGGDCRILPAPDNPGYGGAVYVEGLAPGGSVRFERCVLESNRADAGGGVFVYNAGASFADCTIRDNLATDGAGAYCGYCNAFGDVDFSGCVFNGNDYPEPAVGGYGSGVYYSHSGGTVANCTLADNRAWIGGGILVSTDAEVAVSRTIMAFSPEGQGLAVFNGVALVDHCDIFGNAGGDWVDAIADLSGLDCNLAADPLFCAAGAGDFTLRNDSPCLAETNPGCGSIGALPLGCTSTSAIEEGPGAAPRTAYLSPGYPNPFNPVTNIEYYLADPGPVSLRIYDTAGHCIRTLATGEASPGSHRLSWRGVDDHGRPLATGVYLLRLDAAGIRQCRRLVLIR